MEEGDVSRGGGGDGRARMHSGWSVLVKVENVAAARFLSGAEEN